MKPFALFALPLLALAGCATVSPEARLRSGLVDAGLPPRVAGCMAERMADRLSIDQLRRLQSIASLKDRDVGQMTVEEFLFRVRGFRDVELIEVTTRAALGCAISG
ncbi:hypothetical protein NX02_21745 [Sphingomonas sanxanigenens DSM 19645 = NX02]|uniref:Lipoprotein n=2 Tax=Sphingomonas sanxanigenens TaxID=397260 RepID=W0AK10_9SPHN|nr:hypothetical protein NX02_21745 [Sphingomonas sanxanigenens DSM 19645 = NX02]